MAKLLRWHSDISNNSGKKETEGIPPRVFPFLKTIFSVKCTLPFDLPTGTIGFSIQMESAYRLPVPRVVLEELTLKTLALQY